MATFALIPAAGGGTRLQGAAPKQYAPLAGRPMLWHAIGALCVPQITAVYVVLAQDDTNFASHDWSAFGAKLHPLYCGGATRRDSVLNGLRAVSALTAGTSQPLDADDWMLVHDAARPCLGSSELQKLMSEGAADTIGAILALPVAETVKTAAKDEAGTQRVAATQDRSQLWLAQTPQMFRARLLTEALADYPGATDESSAIERTGLRPRLVAGSRENLKVTYPEDLAIAESILARRKK